ncbi:hypothetical protein [Deinococcus sp. QL22]|uniref:hypothetical protein n=1 Tax=Deinococcus sp. QL22 TaxID=2939437 RepID=UPI002017C828|nr:hypothetical protein [Deinococcus sp. QL22]UQN10824.1 hypothetical protein M1R55_31645 [Deinococcus sp. QL22]
MTKKPRFGSFVTPPTPDLPVESAQPTTEATPQDSATSTTIPPAPSFEERRPFSTRVRPSRKAALDDYVMELKRAGWPVSQEGVLDELLQALNDDPDLRARITARLTKR